MNVKSELFELELFKGSKVDEKKELKKSDITTGCMLPPFFKNIASSLLDLPVRPDDVWLISYPRTGSTWCQEIVWLIVNNFNFAQAKTTIQPLRAPLLESGVYDVEYVKMSGELGCETPQYRRKPIQVYQNAITHDRDLETLISQAINPLQYLASMKSPRCIKTHLSMDLLPTKCFQECKVIYTFRDPRDVCVSYYFLYKMLTNMADVDLKTFGKWFRRGLLMHGNILTHYLGYWAKRHDQNVLLLRYEDMKANLSAVILKIAKFLNKELREEDVIAISEHVKFERMKDNKACNRQDFFNVMTGQPDSFRHFRNHFIRNGHVGDYRNYMTPEQIMEFDEWIKKNLDGTGLSF